MICLLLVSAPLSQSCCLARVTPLPDRVQGFAAHVPSHSSLLGKFCPTSSVEELSQYRD